MHAAGTRGVPINASTNGVITASESKLSTHDLKVSPTAWHEAAHCEQSTLPVDGVAIMVLGLHMQPGFGHCSSSN
jgi:hypothetical protein